jgi:hypothetical protein
MAMAAEDRTQRTSLIIQDLERIVALGANIVSV